MNTVIPSTELLSGLRDARAYNHPTDAIEVLETHISWVILTGRYAYKIKKPVDLDFLNFTTLAQRKHDCEEELRLNGRLSGELYIDVVPIGTVNGRVRVGAEPAGEYTVKMHQFGKQDRLDQRIRQNQTTTGEIVVLAREIAAFHQSRPAVAFGSDFGNLEAVAAHIADNFVQLNRHLSRHQITHFELVKLRLNTAALLHRRASTITERKQIGAVRECHGDLHARNVAHFRDRLIPFDCLEFDASLRCIDVINEVAFMVMDLLAAQRSDLAYAFLNAYLEATGDYDGVEVLRLYLIYRCLVRAKVHAIVGAQQRHADAVVNQSLGSYMRLARSLLFNTEKPWIVVMHGFSGSGKSWLADRLSTAFPAIRVRSDTERKRMHGIHALASSGSGCNSNLYSPLNTVRTYTRLAQIAQTCLCEKFNVIVDAACLRSEQRKIFKDLAHNANARFAIVSCTADESVLRQRVARRADRGASVSEAGLDVLAHQQATFDSLTQHERSATVNVATDMNLASDTLAQQIRRIDTS